MSAHLPPTPFLAIDLAVLDANIERVAAWADKREVLLRPHVKTHKSPEVAHRQLDAGASGITVATGGSWLAAATVRSGSASWKVPLTKKIAAVTLPIRVRYVASYSAPP